MIINGTRTQAIETQRTWNKMESYRVSPAGEDHGPALADDPGADDGDLLLRRHLRRFINQKNRFQIRTQRLEED